MPVICLVHSRLWEWVINKTVLDNRLVNKKGNAGTAVWCEATETTHWDRVTWGWGGGGTILFLFFFNLKISQGGTILDQVDRKASPVEPHSSCHKMPRSRLGKCLRTEPALPRKCRNSRVGMSLRWYVIRSGKQAGLQKVGLAWSGKAFELYSERVFYMGIM